MRACGGLRAGVAVVALLSAACVITPVNHSTEPYRSDPEQARALEQHAAQVCAELEGRATESSQHGSARLLCSARQ